MFVYNCRLVERYNKTVVSLAVLADENPHWQPAVFRRELWGCSTEFRFPTVKLLAHAAQAEELEGSDNPFAWFVLTHLKALETSAMMLRGIGGSCDWCGTCSSGACRRMKFAGCFG